jgi:hypothetical protein
LYFYTSHKFMEKQTWFMPTYHLLAHYGVTLSCATAMKREGLM